MFEKYLESDPTRSMHTLIIKASSEEDRADVTPVSSWHSCLVERRHISQFCFVVSAFFVFGYRLIPQNWLAKEK